MFDTVKTGMLEGKPSGGDAPRRHPFNITFPGAGFASQPHVVFQPWGTDPNGHGTNTVYMLCFETKQGRYIGASGYVRLAEDASVMGSDHLNLSFIAIGTP